MDDRRVNTPNIVYREAEKMPFDNFYAESDKAARRWRKICCLALLLVIGYCALPFVAETVSSLDTPTENETISGDARIERINALCASLPRPEKFSFKNREPLKDYPDGSLVLYRFDSDRPQEEIMPFFLIWFNNNGWKSIAEDGSVFRKGRQTVTIGFYSPYHIPAGYEITCSEAK